MSLSKTQPALAQSILVEGSGAKSKKRRLEILTRRTDFVQTFKSGRRIKPSDWLFFNFASGEMFRCVWTVPRAVGPAVVRNKLKRWCRVWLRAKLPDSDWLNIDLNIGFKAMPDEFYRRMSYAQFASTMEIGWSRLEKALKGAK